MTREEKQKLLDSLTREQRKGIAELIKSTDPDGDYHWNGEDSVWQDDTAETLRWLAAEFESHDPESAID